MKSLQLLREESAGIQSEIKKLLLDNYNFDHAIQEKLDVISKITVLRNDLAVIQREMRERLSA
ncbi:MAG: hypothetical protein JST32_08575 [Bacteroidetes bacterium]|nr:hypothetical protein [Bacteroidota bacterium]